jgi:hypothetical protein
VALTSIACKVMESLLRDPIMDYLLRNDLISPQQHGFLSNQSTASQLLECLDEWTLEIEHMDCIDACDFSRAFDTVSLPKLICKIVSFGIDGHYLS